MSDIIINKQADGVFIHYADSFYFQRYEPVNATGTALNYSEVLMLAMAEEMQRLQAENDRFMEALLDVRASVLSKPPYESYIVDLIDSWLKKIQE